VIRFLTEERGIKHTVSVSLQTQCLWRKELLDDMGFERSSSVIETAKEVRSDSFLLFGRLLSALCATGEKMFGFAKIIISNTDIQN